VYTQCPDCTTVFRLTAEVLRAAQGEVRCGVCARSFNALEHLSEEPFRADAGPAETPPEDSMTVEELPGGEDIELSSANEFLALAAPAPDDAPAEHPRESRGTASLSAEEASLEFHGDAGDLDRLFVVEEQSFAQFDPSTVATRLTASGGGVAGDEPARAPGDNDLERTDEHPIIVLDERDLPEEPAAEEVVLESAPDPAPGPRDSATSAYTAPRILIPEEMRQRLAQEAAARATAAPDFGLPETPAGGARWPWIAAAAVLLLAFAAQVVHSARLSLAKRPGMGPLLAQVYDLLGLPLSPPMDLAAYELRQWGAASDPGQRGRLLLRASIVNRAQFSQPFPLLRLALQDRFGATLGVRDIEPADYLPGETSSKLLGPGERADAEIRIVDPGEEAVGFEMDVCLPQDGGVRCASQITTAAR
jgi:predicted Zn finger-like uncharacterized protein